MTSQAIFANSQTIKTTGHVAAVFTLHGHHKVTVRNVNGQLFATCDTCALSQTIERAAVFATENGIYTIAVDGAELTR